MNPAQDVRNMPRKWENSAKSRKVGMTALAVGQVKFDRC